MESKFLQTHLVLAERFGIDKDECQNLIRVIDKRKRFKKEVPSIVGGIIFVIWMFIFGRGTDVLEGTRWDILDFLWDQGFIGIILMLFLGFGIAILLATITSIILRRRFLIKQFHDHLFTPLCFWCGYSLKGLENESNFIKCPECGERSRTGS